MARKRKPIFISRKEKEYLLENLSMLVAAGMDLVASLDSIAEELKTRTMKKIVLQMRADIEAGSPIWRAADHTMMFPQHTIQLMRVGEESGSLATNLKTLADQEIKDAKFRSKIKSALLYPIFVLASAIVIALGIAWLALPRLATVFQQLDLELPFLTRMLIGLGEFLGKYGYIAVPAIIVALLIIIYLLFMAPGTKEIGREILFNFPGLKKMIQEVEITRFSFLLGTLLEAGLPISAALNSVVEATISRNYKKLYSHVHESINSGESFKDAMEGYKRSRKLIPKPIQQMIIAGEQSGGLPDVLLKITEIYEAKVDITAKNLTVVLEPILLVIVWIAVVIVALAVIIPLYGLLGGL